MNWMPEWARDDPDQEYWQEQARIDEWIAQGEAGEQGPSVAMRGEYATVKEVAARHRRSEKTIRRYIKDGALKAHGDKQHPYRIHREDEIAWIDAMRGRRRERVAKQTPRGPRRNTFKELVSK
jgi:hypothetical protein